MKKSFSNIILFLGICVSSIAQQTDSLSYKTKYKAPKLILKYSISETLGKYPGVVLGLEHPADEFHLMHEAGFIYDISPGTIDPDFEYDYNNFTKVTGFKIKEEIRFYDKLSGHNKNDGFYFGLAAYYNYVTFDNFYGEGIGCTEFNCDYIIRRPGRLRRTRFELTALMGIQTIYLAPLVIDFSVGLGLQHISDKVLNTEEHQDIRATPNLPGPSYQTRNDTYPFGTLNARIGFILK